MDQEIIGRLVEKARSYGLHSCHYCRAFLFDFTPLYEEHGNAGRRVIDELGKRTWDGHVSKVMRFCGFQFSKEIVQKAHLECPLFEMLPHWFPDNGKPMLAYFDLDLDPINCQVRDLYIRLPKGISSLVPELEMPGLPIHPCIRSDMAFSGARDLLTKCLREHHKCKQTGSAPSRLLDVTPGRTRLVDTRFIKDPVCAALSYCWGGPQKSQTTYSNLQDRYREIVLEDLPLTIRDAVHVCRQMDIQYLWVDSICIIQEETKTGDSDKDKEIRKMAGIFSGAILTIAASCASSANEGFLQDRQPYDPGVGIPVRINDNYDIAQLVGRNGGLFECLRVEPIDGRAWTFQEQLLSSRILSFTKHAMQWHCQCQDCCISQDEYHFLSKPSTTLVAYKKGTWRELVQEYCRRDLSNLEDRPIAIAAVAERFATKNPNITASDYVAGLWRTSILEELMWSTYDLERSHENLPTLQGPSWSWVSMPGHIEYNTTSIFEPTASLISVDINLADPHFIFGAVKSGRLLFKGTVLHHHDGRILQSEPNESRIYKGCPQVFIDRRKAPLKEVFLLELGIEPDLPIPSKNVGIALQSTGKPGQFIKVGTYRESYFKLSHGCCMFCQEKGPEGSIIEII